MGQSKPSDILSLSATELARRIRARELSALEVAEAHVRRIESVDKHLNAVVIPLFDEALSRAKAADERQAQGKPPGPLHGVPVTIKEQFRVMGTQTTLGLKHLVGNRATAEGPLVTRLRRAGAIILGKTNVAQTLIYHESDNPVYGRTSNPWNLKRTPGGSSGGEAAIIAAGGSPLGLGGDLGGSIRIPAHFCGIQGLKPTTLRLTNDDVPPGLFSGGQEAILAQPGPIARTVADLCLAMEVLATPGPDGASELIPPMPWPDPSKISIRGLRVGMYTDDGFFSASPALRRAVNEAGGALRTRGAEVEYFAPPDVSEGVRLFLAIEGADGGAWIRSLLKDDRPEPSVRGLLRGSGTPNALRPLISGLLRYRGQHRLAFVLGSLRLMSAREYWQAVAARNTYRSRFLHDMEQGKFDALICPPHALPALTHGGSVDLHVGNAASYAVLYAVLYNVLGMPAGVVSATRVRKSEHSDRPASRDMTEREARSVEEDGAGLPVGVQVAARHWREDIVLAVMAALEEHFRTLPDYPVCPVTVAG
ncbi:MAG: amidase [Chloroflexi bacterium]|nr:amidase [Chloroflexota bacterium]